MPCDDGCWPTCGACAVRSVRRRMLRGEPPPATIAAIAAMPGAVGRAAACGRSCGPSCDSCGDSCGCDPCADPCGDGCCGRCWYRGPLSCLFALFTRGCWCGPNCGERYWGDFYSDPPDCEDPCDCHGNYARRLPQLRRRIPRRRQCISDGGGYHDGGGCKNCGRSAAPRSRHGPGRRRPADGSTKTSSRRRSGRSDTETGDRPSPTGPPGRNTAMQVRVKKVSEPTAATRGLPIRSRQTAHGVCLLQLRPLRFAGHRHELHGGDGACERDCRRAASRSAGVPGSSGPRGSPAGRRGQAARPAAAARGPARRSPGSRRRGRVRASPGSRRRSGWRRSGSPARPAAGAPRRPAARGSRRRRPPGTSSARMAV